MKTKFIKYTDEKGVVCTDKVLTDVYVVEDTPYIYLESAKQLALDKVTEVSDMSFILPEVYYSVDVYKDNTCLFGIDNIHVKKVYSIVSKNIDNILLFKSRKLSENVIVEDKINTVEITDKSVVPLDEDFNMVCIEKNKVITKVVDLEKNWQNDAIKGDIRSVLVEKGRL